MPKLFKTAKEMGVTTILPTIMESDLASDENEKKIKNGAFMNYHKYFIFGFSS